MASGTLYAANLGVDRDEGLNLGTNDYSGMIATPVIPQEEQVCKTGWQSSLQVLLIRPALTWLRNQLRRFGGTKKQESDQTRKLYYVPVGLARYTSSGGRGPPS